jgi:aminopeptidase-like protein
MLVGECVLPGESAQSIVFNAHTCHRAQANDGFAAVAVLFELFKWLQMQHRRFTYRLVLGPEHFGSLFYLSERTRDEIACLAAAVFLDMPGTPATPLRIASSFRGGQSIDHALRNAAANYAQSHVCVGWREGAGNDETVWEAPGWEVPCVEVSRARTTLFPFPEYHTSLDTPDRLDADLLTETLRVLQAAVTCLENDATLHRTFDGLPCLSNPNFDLYLERRDPAIEKGLDHRSEKWGHLLDSLLRYFDGSTSILAIATKHDLPFDELHAYLARFETKGLIRCTPLDLPRMVHASANIPARQQGDPELPAKRLMSSTRGQVKLSAATGARA